MGYKIIYTLDKFGQTLKEVNGHKPNINDIKNITCAFTPNLADYVGVLDNELETIVPMSKNYYDQLNEDDKPKVKNKKKVKK